jgi:membrane-bound metal-dependent hydrolase YbcI (DUF457 family)
MFAIGHFAIGYLTGKASSKLLNVKLNLPLLFAVSVIPDIDLILQPLDQTFFMHRGAMHSIILLSTLMSPFLVRYGKQAVPYLVVLLSHSLIGDFFTGGFEMLWPLSDGWFGGDFIGMASPANVAIELALFAVAAPIMFKTKDLLTMQVGKFKYVSLVVCLGALAGPMFEISQGSGTALPVLLFPPSLFWLVSFSYAILLGFRVKLRHQSQDLK